MPFPVVLIDSPDSIDVVSAKIKGPIETQRLELQAYANGDTPPEPLASGSGRKAALVLLGPGLAAPIPLARRLRQNVPDAQFIFFAGGDQAVLTRELQSPQALMGSHWQVLDLADDRLEEQIGDACNAARLRLQSRTTLDGFNAQLASQAPPTVSELRRYTLSDRFLRSILANASDAIIGTSSDGTIITWNAAAESLFRVPAETAIGTPLESAAGEDWPTVLPVLIRELREGDGASVRRSIRCTNLARQEVEVDLVLSAVRNATGEAIGLSAIARDMTDELELQRQLHASRRLESLGLMAAGVAHTFNNILSSMIGNAELAKHEISADAPAQELLTEVRRSGMRAADLIKRILTFAGEDDLSMQPVDLNALVKEAIEEVRNAAPDSGMVVEYLTNETPEVTADAAKIRQVVVSLLENAHEAATHNDGTITITVGTTPTKSATLSGNPPELGTVADRYAFIDVTDTGIGVDPVALAHIFEPFFSTKFAGRGLGLATVSGIIRGHGGMVDVHSTPGVGSTFRVLLPAS